MTLFMLSLAGIPGTAGFMGKWLIFAAAVNAGEVPLAILGVLMSVVSVYFYLRIPVLMYMHDPAAEEPRMELDSFEAVVPGRASRAGLGPAVGGSALRVVAADPCGSGHRRSTRRRFPATGYSSRVRSTRPIERISLRATGWSPRPRRRA
jgi:hypothetical protein